MRPREHHHQRDQQKGVGNRQDQHKRQRKTPIRVDRREPYEPKEHADRDLGGDARAQEDFADGDKRGAASR